MNNCKRSSDKISLRPSTSSSTPSDVICDVPSQCQLIKTLPHGEPVHSVAISNTLNRVYTGGHKTVKVWDMNQSIITQALLTEVDIKNEDVGGDVFAKCMKLLSDGQTMVIGGETSGKSATIWDLSGPSIRK